MSKKKRRRSSSLRQHKRDKKVLTPPILAIGPMTSVSYSRDFLPDLLWVAAMFDEGGSWDAAYKPLDVIDGFMDYPKNGEKHIVDGRISMFSARQGSATGVRSLMLHDCASSKPHTYDTKPHLHSPDLRWQSSLLRDDPISAAQH